MDINVTIKCPDLPLAAAALVKAISGLAAPRHAETPDTLAYKGDDGLYHLMPQPAADPVQPPVAANPTPVGYSPETPAHAAVPTQATAVPTAATGDVIASAPTVPTTSAPQITGDMVAKAGADLIAANPAAMAQLNGLLQKYGVGCAQELRPDQIGPFATEMRALGAKI